MSIKINMKDHSPEATGAILFINSEKVALGGIFSYTSHKRNYLKASRHSVNIKSAFEAGTYLSAAHSLTC